MADFLTDGFTSEMLRKRDRSMTDPLRRRNSSPLASIADDVLAKLHLQSGLRRQAVLNMWNTVLGSPEWTVAGDYRDSVLYVTMSSSVVRTQLSFQIDYIRAELNRRLGEDRIFVSLYGGDAREAVKKIVMR